MNAMRMAVVRFRLASSRGGLSGSRLRRSMAAKAPTRSSPAAAQAGIAGDIQPNPGPWTRANTTSVTPKVTLSAPGGSNPRCLSRSRSRAITTSTSSSAAPAKATLTRNTASQPNAGGEHAAGQHADHQASRAGTSPHPQDTVAFAALGERGVDERQGGGKDQRPTKTLERARPEASLPLSRDHRQAQLRRRKPGRSRNDPWFSR
jgi:hypothetical protein